jgi:uncharacterized protein YjiS (DUF1127 family)
MITRIKNYIDAYARYKRTKKELYSLSNRELMDIGLHPCDIEPLAKSVFEQTLNSTNTKFNYVWSR